MTGVRLALYFERKAASIRSPFDILADKALFKFFQTLYGLPEEFLGMEDVDRQAAIVEKYMTLSDLEDPDKVSELVKRFTIMYDLRNRPAEPPALALLMGGSPQAGIGGNFSYAMF